VGREVLAGFPGFQWLAQPPKEADGRRRAGDRADEFDQPMNLITSIVAVLAPIVASPIFDALKSLLQAVQQK
jgi:hypothetical protein